MRSVLQYTLRMSLRRGPHVMQLIGTAYWMQSLPGSAMTTKVACWLFYIYILDKTNAYFLPNETYQSKSSHFHEDSLEKVLSWTDDHFKQLGLTTSSGFNKREMILHYDLYVAKLSKMGRLAVRKIQKYVFYLINLVIVYIGFFRSWSWRHAWSGRNSAGNL